LSDPESTPGPTPESELQAEQIERARQIVEAALEVKAERPVALNVREVTSFADVLIILSGRSDRQVRGIVDAIRVALRAQGEKPLAIEGYGEGRWVLIDLSDVIVHVFTPEVRERYDIERLWSDAKPIDLAIEELEDASAGTAS
jgi:ribosome-associated protein